MSRLLRLAGIFLISLSTIAILIFVGLSLVAFSNLDVVFIGAAICTLLISLALAAAGILLIRRTEPKRQASDIPDDPQTLEDLQDEAMEKPFSLDRLNGIGWLLLLGATLLIVAQIVLFIVFRKEIGWHEQTTTIKHWLARAMIFIPLVFLIGVRYGLAWLGISIYRQ